MTAIALKSAALVMLAVPALAQTQTYETPQYSAAPPAELDKNYGLPSFGMPGADLPRQRTMAAEARAEDKPELFKPPAEIALPKGLFPEPGTPAAERSGSDMETPLYTTNEGAATGDTTSSFTTN